MSQNVLVLTGIAALIDFTTDSHWTQLNIYKYIYLINMWWIMKMLIFMGV